MLDGRNDQAAGLRRVLRRRADAVLPVLGADDHGDFVARLSSAARRQGVRLIAVVVEQLLQGAQLPPGAAVLVTGCDSAQLAAAYARIKLVACGGRIDGAIAFFDRPSSLVAAQHGHRRLASAAERFLRMRIEFGGAAASDGAAAFRRLAGALGDWTSAGSVGGCGR